MTLLWQLYCIKFSSQRWNNVWNLNMYNDFVDVVDIDNTLVLNMYDKSGHCFRISLCTYLNVKIRIWIILQIFKLTAIFTCTFKEQFGLCELGVCFQYPPPFPALPMLSTSSEHSSTCWYWTYYSLIIKIRGSSISHSQG